MNNDMVASENTYLGILTNSRHLRKLKQNKLSKQTLVGALKKVDIQVYFFTLKKVDFINKNITGVFYNHKTGRWGEKKFPIPHVIYRRTASLNKPKYSRLKKLLKDHKVKRLNYENSFNKWKVYQGLSQLEDMTPYLPVTKRYNSKVGIKKMLKNYTTVYLKAYKSARGKQIMRVKKINSNKFEYSYYSKKLVRKNVRTYKELFNKVDDYFYTDEILMQPGIDLLSYGNRLVDFRAEVQRNGKGNIEIIAISARAGSESSPITTHAFSYPYDYFFKTLMKYDEQEFSLLEKKVKEFLETTYKSIESIYGKCGEIGIDFGIDQEGDIWYIECNSMSAKVSLKKAFGDDGMRMSYVALLEYAKYIANNKGGLI
ncbi:MULTISPECIES: YheC/YheD family protein [Bacillaceae]|uniref:YheC/YheD family protein n=1 Tax=Evansella alkalicola TaxID=745819 RepID=A0ABS6JYF2_9BACI|nr:MULTISPECIES: YheC/YheD family protein [Bacillaceae]MBU9723620.1 YheC/YheD family protein [Bacillus alkalicola]